MRRGGTSPILTDAEFWCVANCEEFQRRFRGREHPLYPTNGGVAFYDPEKLKRTLATEELEASHRPNRGFSGYAHLGRIGVYKSWIRQNEWIFENAPRILANHS